MTVRNKFCRLCKHRRFDIYCYYPGDFYPQRRNKSLNCPYFEERKSPWGDFVSFIKVRIAWVLSLF